MKKNLFNTLFVSTILAVATIFSSCDEDTGIVIGIPYTQELIYGIDPLTGTSFMKRDTVSSKLDSLLASQEATREDIESIILTNLTLSLTDSLGVVIPTQNFNNVKDVLIRAQTLNTSGGNVLVIGYWDSTSMASIFQNQNPLVLPSLYVGSNLLPYFSETTFALELNTRFNSALAIKYFIKSTTTVTINAKL